LEDANPSESELNTQEGQIKQAIAQNTLSNFWLSIRTYAAQTSVAVSNLNFMLAKRLPTNEEANASSQALNEYRMATWRLFTSSGQAEQDKPNQKWIKELGKAEPGTVQIEIAQLLAEINYQMYLDRQIQERILLANSILLIQNLKMNPPRLDTSSGGGKNKN
jgi:intracellular multiplication protein IcmX